MLSWKTLPRAKRSREAKTFMLITILELWPVSQVFLLLVVENEHSVLFYLFCFFSMADHFIGVNSNSN